MEKYKHSGNQLFLGFFFFIIGAGVLVGMIFNLKEWDEFKETAVPVMAQITDIDTYRVRRGKKSTTHTDVEIRYEYNLTPYSDELGYYIAGMRVGDQVEILVDPEHPNSFMTDPKTSLGPLLMIVLLFGGAGAAILIMEFRKSAYINNLIREDKYIYAMYEKEKRSGTKVNNVMYLQSVFTYTDESGRKFTFASIPHHPDKQEYFPGDTVKVYVDLDADTSKHYVSRENIR